MYKGCTSHSTFPTHTLIITKKFILMTTDYCYQLETPRLTGRCQEKVICPHCGRKLFVRYVDTYDGCNYIGDAVGKCDHEHSCGYHYKPSEYFRDSNPRTAVNHLMAWIHRCKPLWNELQQTGYYPARKPLRHVKCGQSWSNLENPET